MSPPQSSPRPIQIDPTLPSPTNSTAQRRNPPSARSPINAVGGPAHHRSNTGTSYRDNVEVQRQMQQDIDSAMSMSRARSGSIAESPPIAFRGMVPRYSSNNPLLDESPFGMLSDAEERELDRALHIEHEESDEGHSRSYGRHEQDEHGRRGEHSESDTYEGSRIRASRQHSGHRHDTGSSSDDYHDDMAPTEAADLFDFAPMEEFANAERQQLDDHGLKRRRSTNPIRRERSGSATAEGDSSSSTRQDPSSGEDKNGQVYPAEGSLERTMTASAFGDDTEAAFSPKEIEAPAPTNFHRRRARKQAQNQSRKGGKLALFESFGAGGDDDQLGGSFGALKAPRHGKQLPEQQAATEPVAPTSAFVSYTDAPPTGHDRPYRFSFYSNALPVTIHARSLGELPAEGQTFEDLFKGRNPADTFTGAEELVEVVAAQSTSTPTPGPVGTSIQEPSLLSMNAPKSLTNLAASGVRTPDQSPPGGLPTAEEDPDAFTWWLDVLSPTDEEMRMLAKVFGIHPLTVEDILLEETREKIELFRNYYLVCFRSFDQDPYSQTYLEPLNMYIIVFREGTLSFHFRGTPHPQNVRRRIKHLKDYISVTSDWISYALIDDITDAFGPLIQSIEFEVDSIDELVLILKEAEQTDMLRRIGTCRKKVMGLLRLMGSKADVVKGLAKRCNENWLVAPKSDIGLYLSDIQDHLITMTSNLNHYEKILSRSHSNYLAQISIEMTDANNQINDVLSKLTALGTILIPMNLVTGLWGMNVNVPGQGVENLNWFGGILSVLAAFAIVGAYATYRCFSR